MSFEGLLMITSCPAKQRCWQINWQSLDLVHSTNALSSAIWFYEFAKPSTDLSLHISMFSFPTWFFIHIISINLSEDYQDIWLQFWVHTESNSSTYPPLTVCGRTRTRRTLTRWKRLFETLHLDSWLELSRETGISTLSKRILNFSFLVNPLRVRASKMGLQRKPLEMHLPA
jgi:hypothetical protein